MATALNKHQKSNHFGLVHVLLKDETLLRRWSNFSYLLKSKPECKLKWERGINTNTMEYSEVFSEILTSWMQRYPEKTIDDLCKCLRKMECNFTAETVHNQFPKDALLSVILGVETEREEKDDRKKIVLKPPVKFVQTGEEINWPITHGLSFATKNFSGREKELELLNSYFNPNSNLVLLICGLGGIGKTELCKKFANDLPKSPHLCNMSISRVWLNGDTLETLHDSLSKLATELRVAVTDELQPTPQEYFEFLTPLILKHSNRLLVIVDNVDSIYEEVSNVIKTVQLSKYQGMFVIVTSRNKTLFHILENPIELNVLGKEQARAVLQISIENLSDSDADMLCELFQNFPLALQQAISCIKQQQRSHFRTRNYNVCDYIEEFKTNTSKMLNQELGFEHQYLKTTLGTLDMTFKRMFETYKTGGEILQILAYFEPDGIKIHFLEAVCAERNFTNEGFDEGLNMIYKYYVGLVRIENENISIHRLLQQVTRLRMTDSEFQKQLFDNVLLALTKLYDSDQSYNLRTERSHLNCVRKFAFDILVKSDPLHSEPFNFELNFLLKHDRIKCAVEYTKLKHPSIEFSDDCHLIHKRKFLEKILMWGIVGHDVYDYPITNELIETGAYESIRNYTDFIFLNLATQLAIKYFGKNGEMVFKVKSQIAKALLADRDYDGALALCDEILQSEFSNQYKNALQTMHEIGVAVVERGNLPEVN